MYSYYPICVLILPYVCPHTTLYVSSYYHISYYYIHILILPYMCPHTIMSPHTTVCVSSHTTSGRELTGWGGVEGSGRGFTGQGFEGEQVHMPADGSPIIFLARANRSASFSTSAGEPVVSLSMFPPPPPSLQQAATELQHAATALQSVSLSNCRPAPPSSTRTCARASNCAGGGGSSSTDGSGRGRER